MSDITYYARTGEEIEAEQTRIFEELTGETLYEADERRALIKAQSYGFAMLGEYIDHKAKNNFLRTCNEETVNDFGEFKKVSRTEASKSLTTLKFKRIGNLANEQAISYGTKVSAGEIVFQTIETKNFAVNSTECIVQAECITAGSFSNELLPGQINTIIDTDPYVVSVENTTATNNGSDYEDIDIYKAKIRESPEGFSVAGPEDAYKFFVKLADPLISDVHVDSPTPCVVDLYVLMKSGVLPTEEVLNKVVAICSDKKVRPLGDLVTAHVPTVENFGIELSYYIPKDLETLSNSIKAKVDLAVAEFISETKLKLGKDINPDNLRLKILNLGVKRLNITSPNFTVIPKTKVAFGTITSVTYSGVEDE